MNADPRKPFEFEALAADLEGLLCEGPDRSWTDAEFDTLSGRVFRFQFEHNDTYRVFCEGRGIHPDRIASWQDAPAVPATAFKRLALRSTSGHPEAVFRTSGTTAGSDARGRHFVPSLALYRASLVGPFRRHVMTGLERAPFISLVPSPEMAPDSSLSWMIGAAAAVFATDVRWLVDARGRLDTDVLRGSLEEAASGRNAVVVLGTALALVHLLDAIGERPSPPLPDGSRVMETGGFKGALRDVSREELRRRISGATGVPAERIVNEYGMTELLSQLYEPVIEEGPAAAGVHVPPPWLRVRALDPVTLEPVPEGHEGILAFFDLANIGSVCHVLTQDVGSVVDGRVRLRGRLAGAEPRGCSRAMDELMSLARTPG
jgi:hypothetical protein